jgi:His-Xaa-Ser system radical SAM maturase HxsC
MRRVTAVIGPGSTRRAYRVVQFHDLAAQWSPALHFMIPVRGAEESIRVDSLAKRGLTNVCWIDSEELEDGDVLIPETTGNKALISYRTSDAHHALFLTNRCNSYCLMCSQPPTKHDDGWLVGEALDIIRHIRESPATLGLSGGEPLLLGANLRVVLDTLSAHHPTTRIDVLTNGRLLSDAAVAHAVLAGLTAKVQWLVPLYGHADMLHDFVVQSPGAFEETLEGMLVLQENRQPIQLRVVLIKPVLEHLDELCAFIGRNLPFVKEVALIVCEPIGFAMANRELCEVDMTDWAEMLCRASWNLERDQVPQLFMNAPLCALPKKLWKHAHRSISDWKQVYADECDRCTVKASCSGLFAWHTRGWSPSKVIPFEESMA